MMIFATATLSDCIDIIVNLTYSSVVTSSS